MVRHGNAVGVTEVCAVAVMHSPIPAVTGGVDVAGSGMYLFLAGLANVNGHVLLLVAQVFKPRFDA